MKPAPFAYHRPATIAETVRCSPNWRRGRAGTRRRAEPGADHGVSPGAPGAPDRHQPGCRARRAGGRGWQRCASARGVRHAAFHRPVARGRSGSCWQPWCVTSRITRSGCAARSAAASRMPTRRRNGASSRRRLDAELVAVSRRGERVSPAARFLPRRHGDGARARRTPGRGAPAACCRTMLVSALPSSAAAPAIMRWRWRWRCLHLEGGVIANPRLGIGGVEAVPRRLAAAEAVLAGAAPDRERYSARRPRWPPLRDRAARRPANRRAIPARTGRGDGRTGRSPRPACRERR